jgi:hypothetical protein
LQQKSATTSSAAPAINLTGPPGVATKKTANNKAGSKIININHPLLPEMICSPVPIALLPDFWFTFISFHEAIADKMQR